LQKRVAVTIYECDACQRDIDKETFVALCVPCDYSLCESCYNKLAAGPFAEAERRLDDAEEESSSGVEVGLPALEDEESTNHAHAQASKDAFDGRVIFATNVTNQGNAWKVELVEICIADGKAHQGDFRTTMIIEKCAAGILAKKAAKHLGCDEVTAHFMWVNNDSWTPVSTKRKALANNQHTSGLILRAWREPRGSTVADSPPESPEKGTGGANTALRSHFLQDKGAATASQEWGTTDNKVEDGTTASASSLDMATARPPGADALVEAVKVAPTPSSAAMQGHEPCLDGIFIFVFKKIRRGTHIEVRDVATGLEVFSCREKARRASYALVTELVGTLWQGHSAFELGIADGKDSITSLPADWVQEDKCAAVVVRLS